MNSKVDSYKSRNTSFERWRKWRQLRNIRLFGIEKNANILYYKNNKCVLYCETVYHKKKLNVAGKRCAQMNNGTLALCDFEKREVKKCCYESLLNVENA